MRVLIVDDEDSVRSIVRLQLEIDRRFTVVGEAVDGRGAIKAAAELQPDIVILDLMMPGTSGLDALPEIRRCAPEARVIVLSALRESEMGHLAMAQGADAYVDKLVAAGGALPTIVAGVMAGVRERVHRPA